MYTIPVLGGERSATARFILWDVVELLFHPPSFSKQQQTELMEWYIYIVFVAAGLFDPGFARRRRDSPSLFLLTHSTRYDAHIRIRLKWQDDLISFTSKMMPLNCLLFCFYFCLQIYWIGNNNNNNIDETRRQQQTWWSFNCFGQSRLSIIAVAMRTYTTRDSILQTLSGNVQVSFFALDGRAIE